MRTVHGYGLLLLLLLVLGFGADWSGAQSYPTKPIRILTTGAGGSGDVVLRLLAPDLSEALGQPIVVENRAAGVTLTGAAAKATPDGYSLMVNGATVWIAPLLGGEVPYDPIRDFAPITMLVRTPTVLVVTPTLPVKTVTDLIKLAKSKPGELNASTGSNGSAGHVALALLNSLADIDIVRVQYKDQATENADLLSGRTQMSFGAGSYAPFIKTGKLRAIATAGSRRSLLYPDLPIVADTLPGYTSEIVTGFWAPAKTPGAIVRRLHQETLRVLEKPSIREKLLNVGVEPGGVSPEELDQHIKSDMARTAKILKAGQQ